MPDISDDFRWSGVELRHLLALRAVAEEGSVAAAARKLGYSQPAVSQQLAALERLLGSRLVERRVGGRVVALTEPGRRVLPHARALIARAAAADAELQAMQEGTAGRVKLGVIPSIGAQIVPELLRRFGALLPDVDVQLAEDELDVPLLDRVEAGELDVAFAFAPLPDGPFEAVEVLDDPYVLLVRSDAALTRRAQPLPLRALASLDLLVCSQSEAVRTYCEVRGVAARIRYRIHDNATLVGLAAAGIGAALLPRLAVAAGREDVTELELSDPPPPRVITLAWHRDRELPPAGRALVAAAQDICEEIRDGWAKAPQAVPA
jgi:molybdate transport repressor ModE-like protein